MFSKQVKNIKVRLIYISPITLTITTVISEKSIHINTISMYIIHYGLFYINANNYH